MIFSIPLQGGGYQPTTKAEEHFSSHQCHAADGARFFVAEGRLFPSPLADAGLIAWEHVYAIHNVPCARACFGNPRIARPPAPAKSLPAPKMRPGCCAPRAGSLQQYRFLPRMAPRGHSSPQAPFAHARNRAVPTPSRSAHVARRHREDSAVGSNRPLISIQLTSAWIVRNWHPSSAMASQFWRPIRAASVVEPVGLVVGGRPPNPRRGRCAKLVYVKYRPLPAVPPTLEKAMAAGATAALPLPQIGAELSPAARVQAPQGDALPRRSDLLLSHPPGAFRFRCGKLLFPPVRLAGHRRFHKRTPSR